MKSLRLYAAGPLAAVCTSGLFLVMQGLVGGDGEVIIDEAERPRFIDIVQDIDENPPVRLVREVEKPPEVEYPPEIDTPQLETGDPDKINVSIARASPGDGVDIGDIDLGPSSDGEYMPLVLVTAAYPPRAQKRGIEGYAVVELTVAEDGSVPLESVVIIEAEPKGYFERNSIKAAQKFKYKPKVVNGKGQAVTGVRYRFTFNLAE